jgi:uncharacterized protein
MQPIDLPAVSGATELRQVYCVVTERCDLDCATCYRRDDGASMSLDTARAAVDLLARGGASLCWAFTGGEPLLVGQSWYSDLLEHAASDGRTIRWSLQSNLLRLDDGFSALLRRHDVQLGTSIDGPPDLHARHRGHDGAATLERWRELARAGPAPGVTCVVSAESWRRRDELVSFFADLGAPVIRLQALRPLGRDTGLLPPTARMLFEVRWAFAERLLAGGYVFFDPDLYLQLTYLFEGRPSGSNDCTAHRCGAGRSTVTVDTDGTIYPCIAPARVRRFPLGDVQGGFAAEAPARISAFHGSEAWTVRCFDCPARRICFFGCRAVAMATGERFEPECGATQALWAALVGDRRRAVELHQRLQQARARLDPAGYNSIYLPEPRNQNHGRQERQTT